MSARLARSGPIVRIGTWLLALVLWALPAWSAAESGMAMDAHITHWIDGSGSLTADNVSHSSAIDWQPLTDPKPLVLGPRVLWLKLATPALEPGKRWFIQLPGPSNTNHIDFYQADASGRWLAQVAGDQVAVADWSIPDRLPVFELNTAAAAPYALIRIASRPSPVNPVVRLLDERDLVHHRAISWVLLGSYLGFGLMVAFLSWMHVRLYGDKAFIAYLAYVCCMLMFQASYTGLGGVLLWPHAPRWNDLAPAVFVFWLSAAGIWFVREVSALARYSQRLDRGVKTWIALGVLAPALYAAFVSEPALKALNLYGLLSVLLSTGLCIWAWRKGETYAGWTALGFLPLHLAYPFAALRSAGVLADGWMTQYGVLIGSAFEIPLLLYVLHRRAKDFNEVRARMRVLDSTDPVTGLISLPVLLLRLGDAFKRAHRNRQPFAVLMVELSNHNEIEASEGRVMGDRSLLTTASMLSEAVGDVDTVCRVSSNRFVVLLEGPVHKDRLAPIAQLLIARSIRMPTDLPGKLKPRLRVATVSLPNPTDGLAPPPEMAQRCITHLSQALDHADDTRFILHLS